MDLAFAEGFDQSISLPSMNRQCNNVYPKHFQEGEAIVKRLFSIPGQSQLATTGTSSLEANRGSAKMADIPYFVNGTTLYRLNADWTKTSLGTIPGTGHVSMPHNGIQLMVLVPGGNGYIYNKDTAVFAQITDSDFTASGNPQIAMFIDGYFMVNTDSKKFTISALNDGLTWAALDFGTAESDPDSIVSLVNFNNQAYILGADTVEGEENIGGSDFPFLRNGIFMDKGIKARFSVVQSSGTFMFIGGGKGEDSAVWSFQNGSLARVSNTGVELLINALTDTELDQVTAYSYSQDTSTFVAFELPSVTVVYGLDTGKWHTRRSQLADAVGVQTTYGWRSTGLLRAYSKLICFDAHDGRVGDVSRTFFAEYGTEIQREFDVVALRAEGKVIQLPRVEIEMETGVADATTPIPKIRMKKSRNGSVFYGERIRSMGKVGEYDKQMVWRQNGKFKKGAWLRFMCSEKVKVVVTGVHAQIGVGRV